MNDDSQERARQQAVDALGLDTLADTAYDDITRTAAELLGTPIALITILDGDRQWFKSRVGLDAAQTPREHAFCAHAVRDPGQVLIVEDATRDPRFAENPLVTGDPNIRFYAGAPLVLSSGHAVGTVCAIDTRPRHIDAAKVEALRFLAQQVVETLEGRAAAKASDKRP